jgi:hypothetical protein
MDNLIPLIITGVVSFAVGFALKYVEPKSKLVWWSPHNFLFTIQVVPDKPKLELFTHALTIQNLGRKPAEQIEIVHRLRPDHFKLQPSLDYEEDYTPDKEHIIRVPSLASKDFFSIEFLAYVRLPELLYIRSRDGHAQFITIQPQRVFPKWLNILSMIFTLIGFGFTIYWLINAIYFISQNF